MSNFNYSQTPSTVEEWNEIAAKFERDWNFPNCIGALDGKHVVMIAPPHSGSIYYNYKGTHSIVLMAMCDAEYKFTYIDAGRNGRVSDGGVFNQCSLASALQTDQLNLPEPKPLPGRTKAVPFVILADDAFALKPYIMKPFVGRELLESKRVLNYRLSRGRRTIENAFGILSARFRVFRSPIHLDAAKTTKIILACVALHNFLLTRNGTSYAPPGFVDHFDASGNRVDGEWRRDTEENALQEMNERDNSICNNANQIREEFEQYFMTSGAVPWQSKHI